MRSWALLLLAASCLIAVGSAAGQGKPPGGDVAAMERKLDHIEKNGESAHPDSTPTVITEDEVNAYFAAGKIDLPAGVRSVRFQSEPGVVRATTRVDFAQLNGARSSANPLLSIFSGVHDAVVTAQAHGTGGTGYVQVDSVSLDGVEVPRFVLQLFVERFLQPKYPELGLDSKFPMPDRIDTATAGSHVLIIVQK